MRDFETHPIGTQKRLTELRRRIYRQDQKIAAYEVIIAASVAAAFGFLLFRALT